MSYREAYTKAIIRALREEDLTFDSLKRKVKEEGLENYWLMREALLQLMKEGIVEKYPDYECKKFKFRLKSYDRS